MIAARIARAVAEDPHTPVTVSIGLAPLQSSPRATVLAAGMALHQAKAAGRNGVREAGGGTPLVADPGAQKVIA